MTVSEGGQSCDSVKEAINVTVSEGGQSCDSK